MTGAELRSLLTDGKIIRGVYHLPSHEACDRLAERISQMAFDELEYLCQPVCSEGEAIQRSLDDLVKLLAPAKAILIGRRASTDIAALDRLVNAASAVRLRAWSWGPRAVVRLRWHNIVEGLADAFREAMQSTNGLRLGLSNEGPLARFLAAVIPHVTREKPTMDAVARHLQRRGNNVALSVTPG